MKGSKLFKNVRLKGQKELVSILVEDGIFKKIAADIPQEKTVGCEEVDLNQTTGGSTVCRSAFAS